MNVLVRRWPIFMGAAGVLALAGGGLHPEVDTTLPFDSSMAHMLDSGTWVPSHVLLLLAMAAVALGLTGLARSKTLTRVGSTAAVVAAVGGYASVVETIFHAAAVVDHDALVAGGSTPILHTHLALEALVSPLFGLSLAVLMVAECRRLGVAWFLVSMLGTLGAIAYAASAPVVVLSQNPQFAPLFKSAIALAVWFIALALVSSRLRDSAPVRSDAPLEPAVAA